MPELVIISVICLIVLVPLVVGIIVLWWALRRQPASPPQATPLEVLRMRYARGEITQEQFEQIKRDLESTTPGQ